MTSKSIASGIAAAAMVSLFGLAYAQSEEPAQRPDATTQQNGDSLRQPGDQMTPPVAPAEETQSPQAAQPNPPSQPMQQDMNNQAQTPQTQTPAPASVDTPSSADMQAAPAPAAEPAPRADRN